jgi:hypothetical protein
MVIQRSWRLAGALMVALVVLLSSAPRLNAVATVDAVATAKPGEFIFEARGFDDDEDISFWLTGPSQQVVAGEVRTTNGEGRERITMQMPRHFQPGRWAITVHGLKSDLEAIGFFEMPPLGPNAALVVDPPSGPASTTFTFTSNDFDPNERVGYWLTGPDGKAYEGGTATAKASGQVIFYYTFGPGIQTGTWTMSANGLASDKLAVVPFLVE